MEISINEYFKFFNHANFQVWCYEFFHSSYEIPNVAKGNNLKSLIDFYNHHTLYIQM